MDLLILIFFGLQVNFPTVYSMRLQLRRTICKKFEESLDICPFQESHGLNNVRQDTSPLNFHSCGCYRGTGWSARTSDRAMPRDPRMGRFKAPQDSLSHNVEVTCIPTRHIQSTNQPELSTLPTASLKLLPRFHSLTMLVSLLILCSGYTKGYPLPYLHFPSLPSAEEVWMALT